MLCNVSLLQCVLRNSILRNASSLSVLRNASYRPDRRLCSTSTFLQSQNVQADNVAELEFSCLQYTTMVSSQPVVRGVLS